MTWGRSYFHICVICGLSSTKAQLFDSLSSIFSTTESLNIYHAPSTDEFRFWMYEWPESAVPMTRTPVSYSYDGSLSVGRATEGLAIRSSLFSNEMPSFVYGCMSNFVGNRYEFNLKRLIVSKSNSNLLRWTVSVFGSSLIQHRFRASTFLLHFSQKYLLDPSSISPMNDSRDSDRFDLPLTSTLTKNGSSLSLTCSHSLLIIWLQNTPPKISFRVLACSFPFNFSRLSKSPLKNSTTSICIEVFIGSPAQSLLSQNGFVSYAFFSLCIKEKMTLRRLLSGWGSSSSLSPDSSELLSFSTNAHGASRMRCLNLGIMYNCCTREFIQVAPFLSPT
eukprot:29051_1